MKIYQLILVLFCLPNILHAQVDTNARSKELIVQEVQVKGNKGNAPTTPNLQQQTDKVLSGISGITLIKRGNYAQEATIRGLNAGQINTTIDGMHIFGACTDRMDPISSYVEPNNLGSIRLNLGPDENQNGSQTSSLDFKLLKATPSAAKRVSGKVGLGFETNSLARQTLGSVQYSRTRWALQLNAIYRQADNYIAGNKEEILFSQYQKWNAGGSFTGVLNEHHRIYLDYLQDNGKNIGYPALTMDVAFADAKIGSVSHVYEDKSRKLFRWETKVYMNYIDHAMDDTKRPAEQVPMHMDMPGTSKTTGFFSGGSIRLAQQNFLYIKATGYQNDLHAEMTMYPDNGNKMFMLTIPDARRSTLGLNISDKHFFHSGTEISFGGRLEYVQSEITTLIGRQTMTSSYAGNPDKSKLIYNAFVRFEQKLKKKVVLFANASYSLRHASLQEMYGFYLYNRVDAHDYLGNPDLKPEVSLNINLGVKTEHKKWNASAQLFTYQFQNYITGIRLDGYSVMTIGGSGVKQYINLASANISGAEYTIQWKPIEKFLIQTTGAISIGQDVDGEALPFIPPFRSVNKIQYDLKGYFIKAEYTAAAVQNRVSTEKYGEKTTPAFHVFNVGVTKRFSFEKNYLQCSLNLDNILDAVYFEHLDVMKIHRQGRNLTMNVTFVF